MASAGPNASNAAPGNAAPRMPHTPRRQSLPSPWDPMLGVSSDEDDVDVEEDEDDDDDDDDAPNVAWLPSPSLLSSSRYSSGTNDAQTEPPISWRQRLQRRFDPDRRWTRWNAGNIFWGFGSRHPRRKTHYATDYGAMDAPRPAFSPSNIRVAKDPSQYRAGRMNQMQPVGYRTQVVYGESSEHLVRPVPPSPSLRPQRIMEHAFRPSSTAIDELLSSWLRRNLVLIWLPVLLVLVWCGIPFPKSGTEDETSGIQAPHRHTSTYQWVDANFWFFLFWYYGCYVAVALIFITQLFTLYRLNWWPTALGAKTSYTFFWSLSLFCGYLLHLLDPLRISKQKHSDEVQWQLKTEWVLLTFATMAMPACVCLVGLRRRGRQRYRAALTDIQIPFATSDASWRIPASYRRFLWFMSTMALNLCTLLLGQGYANLYLRTLPHTGLDGTLYVLLWLVTVQTLCFVTQWIIVEKVRSRALLFVFRYFYFMVYFIFYRNLFARLRSFDQFALVQLLSSAWVCLWYPLTMSAPWLRFLNRFNSRQVPWEEHAEKISLYFYLRNTAQHTTMLAFLGWLSILHFGINQPLYPFFAFDDNDPYNYRLTMLGSLAIWASEFVSIWATTGICWLMYGVNMAQVGLAEMRLYPELVPTCVWTSLHVLMNMLFFLIRLNFS